MLICTVADRIEAEKIGGVYPTMESLEIEYSKLMAKRMDYLYSLHIDIHNLIEKDLAVDINILNN